MTKLLGVTLDCNKLSWSKHVDTIIARMGRSLSIIKHYSAFLTTLSTRQVQQALVLSHLDYCSFVWLRATKRDLVKLQLAQNRANINNMQVHLSCLKEEEKLTSSLLVFVRSVDMLNAPKCLFKLLTHSLDTHAYPTRHATRGHFTIHKSRTDYGRCIV